MIQNVIFSELWPYRVLRHVVFWMLWFVMVLVSSAAGFHANNIPNMIKADMLSGFGSIIVFSPFCYFILYFIIPKYFSRKRTLHGIAILLCGFVVFYGWDSLIHFLMFPYMGPLKNIPVRTGLDLKFFFFFHVFRFTGVLVCLALMGSIKFLKTWYVKQQENLILVRENATAELQLLKAQVHPHFLFNTLNNIYSFTLTKSPFAAELLEKLSAILRYMIMEGQKGSVPLSKEVDLILDYISLEKVRYGNRLEISVDVSGDPTSKQIAPLLMIPFVENCFKHGSSKMLKNPRVKLTMEIRDHVMHFELINNKPTEHSLPVSANGKGGIGLKNVEKRLQLLYPGKHDLKIESTETTFTVKMRIELTRREQERDSLADTIEPTNQSILYAHT
ncbi:MAG TPA: histidine kinase [Chryseolinea sp.]